MMPIPDKKYEQERLRVGPFDLLHFRDSDARDREKRDTWVLPGTGTLTDDQHHRFPPVSEYADSRRALAIRNVCVATTMQLREIAKQNGWPHPTRHVVTVVRADL